MPGKIGSVFSLDSGQFVKEFMDKRGKIGAMALLVYLSPSTGEPVAMRVNNRRSQVAALKSTYEFEDPITKKMVPFVFTNELRQDRIAVGQPYVGDKSLHYFMCSQVWSKPKDEKKMSTEAADNQLQTWVPNRLRPEEDSAEEPTSTFKLFLPDLKLEKLDQQDLDVLHYILNLDKVLPPCSFTNGSQQEPLIPFQWAFEALNQIPLWNAHDMRDHITNVFGIPLFDRFPEDESIAIHQQWTLLSYFLQMCCPICVSPVEGGHRTWEFIKFYTGAQFDDFTPQEITPGFPMCPNTSLKPFGLSQAAYNFNVWQPTAIWKTINKSLALELQKRSSTIRNLQLMQCGDTYGEFFDLVIQDVNNKFKHLKENELLTQGSFFMDFKAGLAEVNKRLPVISKIVFTRIRRKEPMKAKWEQLDDDVKKTYPGKGGLATLTFDMLMKALVSMILYMHCLYMMINF